MLLTPFGDKLPELHSRFTFVERIGHGAFGEIFRGIDTATETPVAIKRLHSHHADRTLQDRFLREARLLAEVQSPFVVRYIAHGVDASGRSALVLEWLEGEDLALRQDRNPLTMQQAIEVVRQAALGLAALHAQGIVHRDVKPANFFVSEDAQNNLSVKLLDLGIAKVVTDFGLTLDGTRLGTPAYMSPEQARGDEHLTPSSDLFSLGVMLYELLSGRRPFSGSNPYAVLAKIVLEDPPPLRAMVPDLPVELEQIVTRCLAKSPEQRYQTAEHLAVDLANAPAPPARTAHQRDAVPTVQLRSLSVSPSGECRVITTVFADLSHIVVQSLQLTTATDPNEIIDAVAQRYGGLAHRTIGRRWIIVFGGSRTSGDEPQRAARAALALEQSLANPRLAILTMRALTGANGLSGESLDRGSIALDHAHQGIWIDTATARVLRADFLIEGREGTLLLRSERPDTDSAITTTTMMERAVRGKNTSETSSTSASVVLGGLLPFVDRAHAVQQLTDIFLDVRDNVHAAVVTVVGPPGIGKTRLRQEWLLHTQSTTASELSTLLLRADPYSVDTPYGTIARWIAQEAAITGNIPQDKKQQLVRDWAGKYGISTMAATIGRLLGIEFPAGEDPRLDGCLHDPASLRMILRDAWIQILQSRLTSGVLVVAIEDAQWIDNATVDWLNFALDVFSDQRLLVVTLGRPELLSRFNQLFAAFSPTVITLTSLSMKACESLAKKMLVDATEETARNIAQRSGGHPLFLEELIRAAQLGNQHDLPTAVQAAMQVRLDALVVGAKRLALVASVFGTTTWASALTTVAPEIDLQTALPLLLRAEILAERPRSRIANTREYIFRHLLLRETAYAMLPADDRTKIHRLTAQWFVSNGETDHAIIAHHFSLADEPEKAATHYRLSAEQAITTGAYQQALHYISEGLKHAAHGPTNWALHALASEVCHPLGRYREGQNHAETALKYITDPALRLRVTSALSLTLRRSGETAKAHALLTHEINQHPEQTNDDVFTRARWSAEVELAWSYYTDGLHAEAVRLCNHVLSVIPSNQPTYEALTLSAKHALSRALQSQGALEQALTILEQLVPRATSLGHRWRGEGARTSTANVLLTLGQNQEAHVQFLLAYEAAQALRLPSTEGYASIGLSIVASRENAHAESLKHALSAAQIGEKLNAPALMAHAYVLAAYALLRRNETDQAIQYAQRALRIDNIPITWKTAAISMLALGQNSPNDHDKQQLLQCVDPWLKQTLQLEGSLWVAALLSKALTNYGFVPQAQAVDQLASAYLGALLAGVRHHQYRLDMVRQVPEHKAFYAAM